MSANLFPAYVVGFAVIAIALMAAWVFLIGCMDLLRGAWEAMQGREWRWPEGPLRGPGDDSGHVHDRRERIARAEARETFTTGRALNGDAP